MPPARVSFVLPLVALALSCQKATPQPLIYVSNEDGGDVAIVDPNSAQVIARIPVGKRPRGVKLSPDGKVLYVALSGSPKAGPGIDESKLPPADRNADGVGVVDLAARKLVRTIASGRDPEAFDVSQDGKTLFVSNEDAAEMSVVDLSSGTVTARVAVGREPEGVTVRPDGKVVYVTSEQDNEVTAVDMSSLAVLAHIPAGQRPRSIVFARDGKTSFVADEMGGMVTVLDVARSAPASAIKIEQVVKTPLGPRPMGGAISPDGKLVFVSCGRSGSVVVVDVATRTQLRTIDGVGARPWGIGVSPDGKWLYSANGPSDDVSVIEVATGQIAKRVKVTGQPWGIAVGAPGPKPN
jgi:YVTN family beta-propeller protein